MTRMLATVVYYRGAQILNLVRVWWHLYIPLLDHVVSRHSEELGLRSMEQDIISSLFKLSLS